MTVNVASLPRQNSAVTDSSGVMTREWFNYFRRLEDKIGQASVTTVVNGSSVVTTIPYVENTIFDSTTARTLSSGDANSLIEFTNAAAITVTVPAGCAPTDTVIYFKQSNTGQVTLVAGSGVTIETSDSLKTRTQESVIGIKQTAVNQWSLFGDIEPVAPALSVLVRAANSTGAPEWLESSADAEVLTRVGTTLAWAIPSGETPLDTTLTYNMDGTLDVVTTSAGTKTMGYTGDKLTSITGTGIYPSKTFSYTGDQLTSIDVL